MEYSPAYLGNLAYLPMSSSPLVVSIEETSATVEAPPSFIVKILDTEPSTALVNAGNAMLNRMKPITTLAIRTTG